MFGHYSKLNAAIIAALAFMHACDSVDVEEQETQQSTLISLDDACNDLSGVDPDSVQVTILDPDVYASTINPIFDTVIETANGPATCSSSGCHRINSGNGGSFVLNSGATIGSPEMQQNYLSSSLLANPFDPENSALLLEPLTGAFPSVGPHGGGNIFTLGDANYAAILQWIRTPLPIDEVSRLCDAG